MGCGLEMTVDMTITTPTSTERENEGTQAQLVDYNALLFCVVYETTVILFTKIAKMQILLNGMITITLAI